MNTSRLLCAAIVVAAMADSRVAANQTTRPSPQGVVIRGCLTGTKLNRIEPQNVEPAVETKLPDVLIVTTIRVIRSQLKALNGHQIEVTGTLRGIPGVEPGLLVVDSDRGRVYFGGSEPELRKDEPTIHVQLIKDIADTCPAQAN